MIDASVAVRWLLKDEPEYRPQIDQVLTDFEKGQLTLIAPDHINSEVGHAAVQAYRRGRMTWDQGRQMIDTFHNFPITTVPVTPPLLDVAYRRSLLYGCSFYDGLYVGLADELAHPLIHADAKLRHTLKGRFPLQWWIENYQTPYDGMNFTSD